MDNSSVNIPPKGFIQVWSKVPIILRAIMLGLLILIVGQLPTGLIFFNLQITASVPWFLPITLLWLWLLWRYLNGWGWPASTAQIRSQNLRAHKIPTKSLALVNSWWRNRVYRRIRARRFKLTEKDAEGTKGGRDLRGRQFSSQSLATSDI